MDSCKRSASETRGDPTIAVCPLVTGQSFSIVKAISRPHNSWMVPFTEGMGYEGCIPYCR
jgi:hypothetical protein